MRDLLDIKLFSQSFDTPLHPEARIDNGKQIARMYTNLENCISVLSDMKARKSFIFYGKIADQIGLVHKQSEVNSIWEDELLSRIHTDDLQKKYRLEFQFFQLMNTIDASERTDFQVITRLRIKNKDGKYSLMRHRLLYIGSFEDGSVWLALCLYDMIYAHPEFEIPQGIIINTKTGEVLNNEQSRFSDILSEREKEILQFIKHGKRSKEIADQLSLSINTVNRHRQNIFQKLNVTNAMEACKVAETTGMY